MRHWTEIDFSLGIDRTVFLCGLTLSVTGTAEGFIKVNNAPDDDVRVFGGPTVDGQFTEYTHQCVILAFALSSYTRRIDFPERLLASSLTLWHQSANGEPYTIQELRAHRIGAGDRDLICLPRPLPRHRYWPSRLAHTTPSRSLPRLPDSRL